jgi:hypothetical protein
VPGGNRQDGRRPVLPEVREEDRLHGANLPSMQEGRSERSNDAQETPDLCMLRRNVPRRTESTGMAVSILLDDMSVNRQSAFLCRLRREV